MTNYKSVWKHTLEKIRDSTASEQPFATSGAISLIVAVYGSSLVKMSLMLTLKKIRKQRTKADINNIIDQLDQSSASLCKLADKDIIAFHGFLGAIALTPKDEQTRKRRAAMIKSGRLASIRVPLESGIEILKLTDLIVAAVPLCATPLLCDLAVASNMIYTAVQNLGWSVKVNAAKLPPPQVEMLIEKVQQMDRKAKRSSTIVNREVTRKLKGL